MLKLSTTTSKGKFTVQTPERMSEMSVEQFQNVLKDWDGEDWIQAFSIITGIEANTIQNSKDGGLEGAIYQTIAFLLDKREWDSLGKLPMPKTIRLVPIWAKDSPLIPDEVTIPKDIGRLSIGQAIQARKSLEGVKDLREGISIVTAIYLQPLIDKGEFDMLRVIEIEYIIKKMYISKIYPIGFFLLRKLNDYGKTPTNVWHRMLNWIQRARGKG